MARGILRGTAGIAEWFTPEWAARHAAQPVAVQPAYTPPPSYTPPSSGRGDAGGIAYILFIKGVTGGTRPLDASIIGYIEPLLNPVWVFLFVGEQPSRWALIGGSIIITTVVVHTLVQYRSRPPNSG
jgi:hypothetical protein